jgi:hypothetical protein
VSGPKKPEPPTIPELIRRSEASQAEADRRLATHARSERKQRAENDTAPPRISTLLEELVFTQERLLDLETEQTRLLQAILQAVSEPRR